MLDHGLPPASVIASEMGIWLQSGNLDSWEGLGAEAASGKRRFLTMTGAPLLSLALNDVVWGQKPDACTNHYEGGNWRQSKHIKKVSLQRRHPESSAHIPKNASKDIAQLFKLDIIGYSITCSCRHLSAILCYMLGILLNIT